jgi:hypothetical protein
MIARWNALTPARWLGKAMRLEPNEPFRRLRVVEEFPQRLGHRTPAWVTTGAIFHVRIRADRSQPVSLIDPALAPALLEAARRYRALVV